LIDMAQVAMATRERDLDNFAYGDCRDVRMVDDGDGLQWILIGTLPERRPILRTTYGMLTLRNGVPIGYVGADALFQCVRRCFSAWTFLSIRFPPFAAAKRRLFSAACSRPCEPYLAPAHLPWNRISSATKTMRPSIPVHGGSTTSSVFGRATTPSVRWRAAN